MNEVSGNGIREIEDSQESKNHPQSNTTISRIERICKAFDQMQPRDYKLFFQCESLINGYFANDKTIPQNMKRVEQKRSQQRESNHAKDKEDEEQNKEPDEESDGDESTDSDMNKDNKKKKWWISDIHKKKIGPISWAELVEMYKTSDEINANCYIWNKKHTDNKWVKIKKVSKVYDGLEKADKTDDDALDKVKWYVVDTKKQRRGPITTKAIIELKKQKLIKPSSLIWNGKTIKKWTPIKDVPVLMDILKKNHQSSKHKDNPKKSENKLETEKKLKFESKPGDEKFNKFKWYVVDNERKKHGPLTFEEFGTMYCESEQINEQSFVWNGKSIKNWTKIIDVKDLFDRLHSNSE